MYRLRARRYFSHALKRGSEPENNGDECENELYSILEDWVLLGLKKSHEFPIIEGMDLNKEIVRESLEILQTRGIYPITTWLWF